MEIYTKEDFKQIFINLGITKGSFVLLEADLSRYSGLVGNYQMLIETLQELIQIQVYCVCHVFRILV